MANGLGIDEGLFVRVNGVEQWVSIRGRNRSNPALLIVTGPGVAFSRLTPFFSPWERLFTLVQWDQPGAGSTYAKNGDAASGAVSLDRLVTDGATVAEFARERLGVSRVILLGISGGSVVGLQMARRRPDLLSAYVGTGQIVNWRSQSARSYEMTLSRARASRAEETVAELDRIGPPPYPELAAEFVLSKHANVMTPAEQAAFANLDAETAAAMRTPPEGARWVPRDCAAVDQRARAMAMYAMLRAEIAAFDARSLGPDFDAPLFFFLGDQDFYTPAADVEAFCANVRAPSKQLVLVEGGGHSAVFLRDPFLRLLATV